MGDPRAEYREASRLLKVRNDALLILERERAKGSARDPWLVASLAQMVHLLEQEMVVPEGERRSPDPNVVADEPRILDG